MIEDTMFDNDCYAVFLEKEHEKGEAMDDLISRQAVKDMIKNHKSDFSTEKDYRTARACVNAVPSAQPERTCVNCGRTANNGGWYADGGTRCPIEEHYALPKDGYCHLWEKRSVTDDDYPERRTDD